MRLGEVVGHAREVAILKRSATSGRLAHAYIFSGPDGVGKRTVAMALARALNCENPGVGEGRGEGSGEGGFDSCGRCASCESMDGGGHLNLAVLEPTVSDGKGGYFVDRGDDRGPVKGSIVKGSIRIAQVRELQGRFRFAIDKGKRVAVIDSADRLMPEAANAFLKTLEEPPPDTVIILITSRASALLPTVISRCQRMTFAPLPEDVVVKMVMEEFEGEVDRASAERAARFSGGSLSLAMVAAGGEELERLEGLASRIFSIDGRDATSVLESAKDLSREEDLDGVLEYMKGRCRDLAVTATGDGANSEGAVRAYGLVEEARLSVAPPRNGNKQLAMEVLVMGLLGGS